jgi:L-ribulokinase
MSSYAIGIDYGTNSARALVVDCANGDEVATAVFDYPSGDQGILLDPKDPELARQSPSDYVAALEGCVRAVLSDASKPGGFSAARVIGIGVDTTGSTPLPVDARATPLAFDPRFRDRLAAQAWLWKDHTAAEEAQRITELAAAHAPQYLAVIGGRYSSEWWWSKLWHCLKTDPEVFEAAYSWLELADFIPALLTGATRPENVKRSLCAAGHKAMYSETWGGLPAKEFLARLDPRLAPLRDRLYDRAHAADVTAGGLCADWARRLGLPEGIPVAVGAFDAHLGAVGAAIRPGTLVKIIGTSTCDCIVWPAAQSIADIPGICGIVKGSILPGHYGIEAGQSAVGDIFKWFVEKVVGGNATAHDELTREALALQPGESGLLALDWNNGNRTILVDPRLSGLVVGLTLHSTRAEIYRALIEATAFGARVIVERLQQYGVAIERVVNCGGIAEKNDLLMQIYADVLGCPMLVSRSSQTPALGSAVAASVCAGSARGGHADFPAAQAAMTGLKQRRFDPDPRRKAVYDELFALYKELHDTFGGVRQAPGLGDSMKRLIAIRDRERGL